MVLFRSFFCAFLLGFSFSFSNCVAGNKNYTIESLEGKSQKITVGKSAKGDDILQVVHGRDTLFVYDNKYNEIEVKNLNKQFLQITYSAPGGSTVHNYNELIVCMKDGVLRTCLSIRSHTSSYSNNPVPVGLYEVKAAMEKGDSSLALAVHNMSKMPGEPQNRWFDHNANYTLMFNKKDAIFYNATKPLNGAFTLTSGGANKKEIRREIKGDFPAIHIEGGDYYFIDDAWFRIGRDNRLYTSGGKGFME